MARAVRDAGGRALIVGGWVRDTLLGGTSKDIDIEAYGLPAERRTRRGQQRRRQLRRLQARSARRLASPHRVEGRPRPPRIQRDRRPGAAVGGGGAAP
ncbi:MAG: hypothetical protein J4F30_06885 [Acidobacteria bacterium]|nr:hypothetical protein [Acidobacteriota bacterium]